jgi:hypothetical protein
MIDGPPAQHSPTVTKLLVDLNRVARERDQAEARERRILFGIDQALALLSDRPERRIA